MQPRGWLGTNGPMVRSEADGDSRLIYVGRRRCLVQWYQGRRYTWWWVRGFALTVRVGRLQVQWL